MHKHINDVRANDTLKCSDVIMVSETHLIAGDADVDYNIEGFQNIYCLDETTDHVLRPMDPWTSYICKKWYLSKGNTEAT